jgi:hypothetical protein
VTIALIGAPSNLGLRPPEPGSVPGTAKAPEALREAGLHARLIASGARDAGTVLAPRYRDDLRPGTARLRNQDAIVTYTQSLAVRVGQCLEPARISRPPSASIGIRSLTSTADVPIFGGRTPSTWAAEPTTSISTRSRTRSR